MFWLEIPSLVATNMAANCPVVLLNISSGVSRCGHWPGNLHAELESTTDQVRQDLLITSTLPDVPAGQ